MKTGRTAWILDITRKWPFVFALMVVLAGGGCRQVQKDSSALDPVGTYALVSVDGKQVPCTIEHDGHSLAIKSGTFVINADGTCTSKIGFLAPSGQEMTREVKADYTREGSELTMRWERAGTTIGRVADDHFTMNNEGMVFSYRK